MKQYEDLKITLIFFEDNVFCGASRDDDGLGGWTDSNQGSEDWN